MATVESIPKFFVPRPNPENEARVQLELETRRLILQRKLSELVEPQLLWEMFVRYRYVDPGRAQNGNGGGPPTPSDDVQYEDLRIDYEAYRKACTRFIDPEDFFTHPVFNPRTFAIFERCPRTHTVPVVGLFTFIAKKLLLYDLRVRLEACASGPGGSLTQNDLEQFIAEVRPHLKVARDLTPSLLPYYLCHAARKFMFFSGRPSIHGVQTVMVNAVLGSEAFQELLRLYEVNRDDAIVDYPAGTCVELLAADSSDIGAGALVTVQAVVRTINADGTLDVTTQDGDDRHGVARNDVYWYGETQVDPSSAGGDNNWFCPTTMHKVYTHYCALDEDQDGMLSVDEMRNYNGASFTPLAIARVFEAHPTFDQKLDFKRYIDFVLATENTHTPAALKYLWKVLDAEGEGTRLSMRTLRLFAKEIAARLQADDLMSIDTDGIMREIVDMVNPIDHEAVTKDDMFRCGQQGMVLSILLDYRAFLHYDSREQLAAMAAQSGEDYFVN
jgi:Ca2+-binding EF-hand superfamily protein